MNSLNKTKKEQKPTVISMREFYRNMKKYQARVAMGESFSVHSRKDPVFRVVPEKKEETTQSMEELFALAKTMNSGMKNASMTVDSIYE